MEQNMKLSVMAIDDNITNLDVIRKALEDQYHVILLPSGEKALAILQKVTPDLILLDVEMPGLNGFDMIKLIKKMPPPVCDIPIIFVTAKDDSTSELEGLDLGAIDYISKPFSFTLLRKRVEVHLKLASQQKQLLNYSINLESMVQEKTKQITKLQYSVIYSLSDMVERRDGNSGNHLLRTSNYVKLLIDTMKKEGYYGKVTQSIDSELCSYASQMHDVGKISIPDSILLKPGKLTNEEFDIMKQHTVIGAKAIQHAMANLQGADFLRAASEFAIAHHEKWDGTGYPYHLSGEDIPINGRIMAIADVYDALVSERPYKRAFSHEEAAEIILTGSGKHFDPVLVDIFKKLANDFKEIAYSFS